MKRFAGSHKASILKIDVLVIENRGWNKSRHPANRGKSRNKSNKFVNVKCQHIKRFCHGLKNKNQNGKITKKKKDDKKEDNVVAILDDFFFCMMMMSLILLRMR